MNRTTRKLGLVDWACRKCVAKMGINTSKVESVWFGCCWMIKYGFWDLGVVGQKFGLRFGWCWFGCCWMIKYGFEIWMLLDDKIWINIWMYWFQRYWKFGFQDLCVVNARVFGVDNLGVAWVLTDFWEIIIIIIIIIIISKEIIFKWG